MHHAGSNNEYQRLALHLAEERLACAWRAVAERVASRDPSMLDSRATPATIACLAAQMPLVRAFHLVINRERFFLTLEMLSVGGLEGLYHSRVHQASHTTDDSTAHAYLMLACLVADELGECRDSC